MSLLWGIVTGAFLENSSIYHFLGIWNLARTLSKMSFLRGLKKIRKTQKGVFLGSRKLVQI